MAVGVRFTYDRKSRVTGDTTAVTKAVHEALMELWRGAVRAYLLAIIEPGVIKVDTGMSKATLLHVARMVGVYSKVNASINPRRQRVAGVVDDWATGRGDRRRFKTKALGEEIGKSKDTYHLAYGTPKNPLLQFYFNIKVYQYWLHENGYKDPSGQAHAAQHSLQVGRAAFRQFIRENISKVVDMKSVINSMLGKGSFKIGYNTRSPINVR